MPTSSHKSKSRPILVGVAQDRVADVDLASGQGDQGLTMAFALRSAAVVGGPRGRITLEGRTA
ncbi:hypothetical protein C6376_08055 [Streptomyces sp. P3]|nr:hypothetical protein C6376_08055 [Streptomyces sp. P3]